MLSTLEAMPRFNKTYASNLKAKCLDKWLSITLSMLVNNLNNVAITIFFTWSLLGDTVTLVATKNFNLRFFYGVTIQLIAMSQIQLL